MDGKYTIPSLSSWAGQYDPMQIGLQDIFARPSMPSQPSQPFRSGNPEDADIDALMYPVAPGNPLNLTVIGIRVNGSSTNRKTYLPEIYQRAGIPFVCHSCGKDLSAEYTYIGDHQPPSKLREKAACITPGSSANGLYSRIINRIAHNPELVLYEFTCRIKDPTSGQMRTVSLQTNNFDIISTLSGTWQKSVIYAPSLLNQHLYPHCSYCSNRQGKIMM